jgi:tetratricopeptide (TPR) repeat protein
MADEKLTRYLAAVDAVRASRNEAVSPDTQAQIARELGMSDEDLAAARAEGEKDLSQALGFLRHGSPREALRALQEADALLPDDLRVASALMKAHAELGDRKAAAVAARRCLELDPTHDPAFRVLRAQEGLPRWILPAFGAAVLLGGISAVIGLSNPARTPRGDDSAVLGPCGGERYCEFDVEIRPDREKPLADLAFPVARVHLSPEDARVTLAGRITHRGPTELEELLLELAFLDEQGRELARVTSPAKAGHAPPLRDGDSEAFLYADKVPRRTRVVLVTPRAGKTVPAPAAFPPADEVVLAFEPPLAPGFAITASYRSRKRQKLGPKTSSEAVLEVRNAGSTVIRGLDLAWRAVGPPSVPEPHRQSIVYQYLTPMMPGERRLVRLHSYVPGDVTDEQVVVTKVE